MADSTQNPGVPTSGAGYGLTEDALSKADPVLDAIIASCAKGITDIDAAGVPDITSISRSHTRGLGKAFAVADEIMAAVEGDPSVIPSSVSMPLFKAALAAYHKVTGVLTAIRKIEERIGSFKLIIGAYISKVIRDIYALCKRLAQDGNVTAIQVVRIMRDFYRKTTNVSAQTPKKT
jgi:hypothetical protein